MNFIARLFPRRPVANQMEIRFHIEANYYGEHGLLNASHVRQGLKGVDIRFVFVGAVEPPKLDLATLQYIWDAARYQGYIPHHIASYGVANDAIAKLPELAQTDVGLGVLAPDALSAEILPGYSMGQDMIAYPQYYEGKAEELHSMFFSNRRREIARFLESQGVVATVGSPEQKVAWYEAMRTIRKGPGSVLKDTQETTQENAPLLTLQQDRLLNPEAYAGVDSEVGLNRVYSERHRVGLVASTAHPGVQDAIRTFSHSHE